MAFRVLNVQREHTQALQDGIERYKISIQPFCLPLRESEKRAGVMGITRPSNLSAGEAPSLLESSWTTTFLESAYHCSFHQFSANQKSLCPSFSMERVHATPSSSRQAAPARLLPKHLLSVVERAARSPSKEAGVL